MGTSRGDQVQRSESRLVLSPTDLVNYLHCHHLTELSPVLDGRLEKPNGTDPELAVLTSLGIEHEQGYLANSSDRA